MFSGKLYPIPAAVPGRLAQGDASPLLLFVIYYYPPHSESPRILWTGVESGPRALP
jgi:hypothetical protein